MKTICKGFSIKCHFRCCYTDAFKCADIKYKYSNTGHNTHDCVDESVIQSWIKSLNQCIDMNNKKGFISIHERYNKLSGNEIYTPIYQILLNGYGKFEDINMVFKLYDQILCHSEYQKNSDIINTILNIDILKYVVYIFDYYSS